MVLAVLMSRSGGYNGVDECESCRTWKVQLFGRRKTRLCSSKMKPRLRAEWVVLREQFYILAIVVV